jgi:hypothetical protein
MLAVHCQAKSEIWRALLLNYAREAACAQLVNSQGSGAKLPEADRADLEVCLEKVNQLLPVLGVELLVPHILKKEAGSAGDELVCEVIGARATGQRTPSGFVVLLILRLFFLRVAFQ